MTVTNILKSTKIKRGTGDKIKTMTKMILPIVDTISLLISTGSINYR